MSKWDFDKRLRKILRPRVCLHPNRDCEGGIVDAHSIQRTGGLSKVARNGHVYFTKLGTADLQKSGGLVLPKLVGVKQAATFTGFCNKHDSSTFSPIEVRPFTASKEQVFLFAYRALCREVYAKVGAARAIQEFSAEGRKNGRIHNRPVREFLEGFELGTKASLRRMLFHKDILDSMLLAKDFRAMEGYLVRLDRTPDVLCSGVFQPEYDYQGSFLQSVGDFSLGFKPIMVSAFPTGDVGAVLFAWHRDHAKGVKDLAESLDRLGDGAIADATVRSLFQWFENIAIRPDWWESLPNVTRDALIRRFQQGMPPEAMPNPSALLPDGLKYVNWVVTFKGFC
jgi:hypothetical protein